MLIFLRENKFSIAQGNFFEMSLIYILGYEGKHHGIEIAGKNYMRF